LLDFLYGGTNDDIIDTGQMVGGSNATTIGDASEPKPSNSANFD